jgi:AraC-like DNA-binding protein
MSKKFDPKFTRASLILLPLAKAFVSRGGDIEAILVRNGVPVRALTDPTMPIEAAACFSTVEDMAETLGDPYFAARVAIEAAKTGSPGIREAASHAVNLGDFLSRVVMEVSKQVNNVVHSVTISSGAASFETQRTANVSGPTTQADAVGAAFYVTVIKQGIGDAFDPTRVILTVPTNAALPPDLLPKQAVIKSAINGWRICFPPEWLLAPFSLDWDLRASSRGEFRPDSKDEATLAYLRDVLADNISDQDLPLNSFAAICGLHPRRVQRILSARGTSYSQIKEDVRRSLTEDLLSDTTKPIEEIAQQVGLSGSAALHRAFRRWTGKTPTRFRANAFSSKALPDADHSNPER